MRTSILQTLLLACLLFSNQAVPVFGQQARQKVITRIFWQDRDTDQLSYADLVTTNKWSIRRGWVKDFPKLDAERQDLVQMKHLDGILMVGVRDHEDGANQSGWVALDTGVFEEPHGNHTHWKYTRKPTVTLARLDDQQGNPAHLYTYDRQFYLANDTKNGFTQAAPAALKSKSTRAARFYPGGGNHITLAAVEHKVAYSSWIDGGGPNAGRVDVVNLQAASPAINYSLKLPSGVIHGATHNSGKVFFAPADGICWVDADRAVSQSAESVEIHHLPLGTDDESGKPLRTGAFENHRNWVLFSTGAADQAALCLINAALAEPEVLKLKIPVADGLKLMTPSAVLSLGKRYAFLFQDRTDPDSDVQEMLTIVELDPNRDRDFSDARVVKSLSVGGSSVRGHFGHHAIAFDAYGRYAVFTEPAEGIINVLSLQNKKIVARFRVGGTPDSILAVGAAEHFH